MRGTSRSPRDQKTNSLRLKLKRWEHEFATRNGGRRPSQEDIKQDAKIASSYREYHKLRQVDKSAAPPTTLFDVNTWDEELPAERWSGGGSTDLSTWSSDIAHLKTRPAAPIESKYLNTEKIKATPQKNGKVLGIFDTSFYARFPPQTSTSPSRITRRSTTILPNLPPQDDVILCTPSKTTRNKSFALTGDLTTPSKRQKFCNALSESETPGMDFALQFRDSSCPDDVFSTPQALRPYHVDSGVLLRSPGSPSLPGSAPNLIHRKPPLKALTSMLAELRQAEDESFVDDEDALHSIHNEDAAGNSNQPMGKQMTGLLEQASQTPGRRDPDDGTRESIRLPDNASDGCQAVRVASDNPLPATWKKKGLKRQTRRSILRPTQLLVSNDASKHAKMPQFGARKTKVVANFQKLKLKKASGLRQRWSRNRHSN